MSQWRLNDDDFEDDDDYSKTNVEKKADAPWNNGAKDISKSQYETNKIDKQTNDDHYSKTNVEKKTDAPWNNGAKEVLKSQFKTNKKMMMNLKIMMTIQKQTLKRKLMHLEHIGAKDISKSQILFSKCFSFSKEIVKKITKNYNDTLWRWWLLKNKR